MADADRVVVELLAKVDQFDQPVKQSATKFSQAMDQVTASATKAEAAVTGTSSRRVSAVQRESAQISQFAKTLGSDMLQVGNILTGDSSPFVVPVKQGPAVTKAMSLIETGAGLMGGALGGVAVAGAVALGGVLLDLVLKSGKANDEIGKLVAKMKEQYEQALLNKQANEAWLHTYEGSTENINKLVKALDDENRSLRDNIGLKQASLKGSIADQERIRADLVQQLRDKQLQLGRANSMAGGGFLDKNSIIRDMADLSSRILQIDTNIRDAQRGIAESMFPLIARTAKEAIDPIAKINRQFDDLIDGAKKAGTYTQTWANQNERLRKSALDAAQAAERLNKAGSGQMGRRVSFDDAAAIARGAGLNVTSAYRSTAHQAELYNDPSVNRPGNPVARPGTSTHEGVNGRWALDIAFAPGLSAQSLKKLYGDQGVSLTAIYKEKGHYHIEGNRTQAEIASDRTANRSASEEERAAAQMSRRLADQMDKEQQIDLLKDRQLTHTQAITANVMTLDDILQSGILPSTADAEKLFDRMRASSEEFASFSEHAIDELLNPDNWKHWGDTAKSVLHELMAEIIKLGAINPLKNLLFGQNNGTLGDLFGKLFGAGGLGKSLFPVVGGVDPLAPLPARAAGGPVESGTAYMVGERGPEVFVPKGSGTIIPNNASAASPMGGMSPATVRVLVEASKYFDGRVLEVAGPVMAQVGASAANGGASISRRNLSRESQHRLG